ncbi:aldo/keto reductase (plasmid) [Paracoccus ferrooxidans]|nr:aldo/keto reductase [Paracoccus ferrooxidans]
MDYRKLGRSGLTVSAVGLGCNNFNWTTDEAQSRRVVDAALDAGITFFDTANIYGRSGGSEEFLGRALGLRRGRAVVATKFGMQMADGSRGADRSYIIRCVEDSLRRLGTDWIDLYQLHESDPTTPIEETLDALDRLIAQGKVRYIGASNMADWEIAHAHHLARELGVQHFISLQAEYSLIRRGAEATTIPCLNALGLGLLPYFPLASGLLTGKYRGGDTGEGRFGKIARLADRYLTPENLARVDRIADWCDQNGLAMTEVAFAWLLSRPVVASVMAGATKPEQVIANAKAAELRLSEAQIGELEALLQDE